MTLTLKKKGEESSAKRRVNILCKRNLNILKIPLLWFSELIELGNIDHFKEIFKLSNSVLWLH